MNSSNERQRRNVEAVRTFYNLEMGKQLDKWTAMCAPDVIIDFPFAIDRHAQLVTGRD